MGQNVASVITLTHGVAFRAGLACAAPEKRNLLNRKGKYAGENRVFRRPHGLAEGPDSAKIPAGNFRQ
jgi:hypothetical protein